MSDFLTLDEWKEWLLEQRLTEPEIEDLIRFYKLTPTSNVGTKEYWTVKFLMPVEDWVEEIGAILDIKYQISVGTYIQQQFLSDAEKFATDCANHFMETIDVSLLCYCPSTKRIVIFQY